MVVVVKVVVEEENEEAVEVKVESVDVLRRRKRRSW